MKIETRRKLLEAAAFIEQTAQNEQIYDTVVINEWAEIESKAKNLKGEIKLLETEEEYKRRTEKE